MDLQKTKKIDFVEFCEKKDVLILCRYLLGMYSIKMKMFAQLNPVETVPCVESIQTHQH